MIDHKLDSFNVVIARRLPVVGFDNDSVFISSDVREALRVAAAVERLAPEVDVSIWQWSVSKKGSHRILEIVNRRWRVGADVDVRGPR